MSIEYLAAPYSHQDPSIMHARFLAANRAAGKLMRDGKTVFSPISHSVPIADALGGGHLDRAFWMRTDLPLLDFCDRLIVLKLDGWQDSLGVTTEIQYAKDHCILIEYMEPV